MNSEIQGYQNRCKFLLAIISILFLNASASGQIEFDEYFQEMGLRADLIITGDDKSSEIVFQELRLEPNWAGNKRNLIDPFEYGDHMFKVRDAETGKLIYSKGFSTLFSEWQTTEESKKIRRSFYQVINFPYPKEDVILEVYDRNDENRFDKIYELSIDPQSHYINRDTPIALNITDIVINGDPTDMVDVAFVAEGYRDDEKEKFIEDAREFSDYLLSREPFSDYKKSFNVRAVHALSVESGTDIPGQDIWKNTACNSNFYTFGLERYLTTFDFKSVCDYAGQVPYDHIFVIVNHEKYGGGGMYNHYSMGTSDHLYSLKVFIHEFGHGFGGLGDEYYNSEVAYTEFYKLHLEPWEPNLTTLVDFDSKWKDMLNDTIPVPTPDQENYLNITGVFEGGGYVAEGVYRPAISCTMKNTSSAGDFCEVCERALIRMIKYHTE